MMDSLTVFTKLKFEVIAVNIGIREIGSIATNSPQKVLKENIMHESYIVTNFINLCNLLI